MSTPLRGRGGGTARGSSTPASRARGSNIRGRGRSRAGPSTTSSGSPVAAGLLQQLRSGTLQKASENGGKNTPSRGRGTGTRGYNATARRGRGALSQSFNTPSKPSTSSSIAGTPSPAPTSSYRDFMAHMTDKFQTLKPKRDVERKRAIEDGFLADPEKKTSLANAITPVGTCTDMCPEFERVERIVQNMVDKAEKVSNESLGRDLPAEDRMIKRFRRSAAGYDEQLPSDIRTPETLRRTLDYLLDKVIGGGERLASIHKFVWDRTRGIRNDFSIQQVTKAQDVTIAIDCFERIARFHILSLHQLSNPNNLLEGEHFDAHQEREQLNNTLLSLMYYYDDNRMKISLPNEAEFRAYCILFELQALTPDLEERMQSWPEDLLKTPRIQTAFKLYAAASNTVFDQGPLKPLVPFFIAQANLGRFWTLMSSDEVSYMMACVAEMNFAMVRFTALDALWRSGKSAPQGQQQRNQEWTLGELTDHLGFDDEEQILDFIQEFGLACGTTSTGEQYLDFTVTAATSLDRSSIPSQQIFSQEIVERKRWRRTLVAVINGVGVAKAIREGLIVEASLDEQDTNQGSVNAGEETLFIPDQSNGPRTSSPSAFSSSLNPGAKTFQPNFSAEPATSNQISKPIFTTKFGENLGQPALQSGFGMPSTVFESQRANADDKTTTLGPGISTAFGQLTKQNPTSQSLVDPSKGLHSSVNNQEKVSAPVQNFTFGKPAAAFIPSANNLENALVANPFGPSMNSSNKGPGSQQVTPAPSTSSVPSAAQTTSPLSTFFGEKLLKQQSQASTFQPQSQPPQQVPLPTFNFADKSVHSSVEKQDAPKSTLSTSNPDSNHSKPVFTFPGVPSAPTATKSSSSPTTGSAQSPTDVSAPVFNFARPSTPSKVESQPKSSDIASKPENSDYSTTPRGSPERPQFGNFKFPPSKNIQSSTANARPDPASQSAASGLVPANRSARATSPLTTKDLAPLTPDPSPEIDKSALAEVVAQLALTQSQGLLEYFIGQHVSRLLQGIVKEYQTNLHNTIITYVRTRHLARKFFSLWKNTTRRSALKRRGEQRRKLLAAAMQAEAEKRKRNEAELEAILLATQETKRLQAAARSRQVEVSNPNENTAASSSGNVISMGQTAGTKRKELTSNASHRLSTGSPNTIQRSHKRSRTLGSFSESSVSTRLSSPSPNLPASSTSTRLVQSYFGRSISPQSFRQSLTSSKVDATKTDYFKLKAMGIDPDTPILPDTAHTLALRQQRQEEERQTLVSRIRRRDRSSSRLSAQAQQTNDMPPPPKPNVIAIPDASIRPASSGSTATNDEDEFLRSLREARETMSQDQEWFKTATASLETEIQQQELRQSQLLQTNAASRRSSITGLARANGYDYYATDNRPGSSLSRTERRIRATGAHGFATKPIRDSTGSPSANVSRTSVGTDNDVASDYATFEKTTTPSKISGLLVLDHTLTSHSVNSPPEPAVFTTRGTDLQTAKRQRLDELNHPGKRQKGTNEMHNSLRSSNRFAGLSQADSEDEEDEDDHLEAEDVHDHEDAEDEDEDEVGLYNGAVSSLPEEELVEDDDADDNVHDSSSQDEDDIEDDDSESGYVPSNKSGIGHFAASHRANDAGTTSTFDQSGPGNTADDALVLSD